MDEMVYLAMTGAKQTELAQAINANNLANLSTTGFRADLQHHGEYLKNEDAANRKEQELLFDQDGYCPDGPTQRLGSHIASKANSFRAGLNRDNPRFSHSTKPLRIEGTMYRM